MMKRVFAGFLCLVVVVSACRPVRAHAIAPALAAAPEVGYLLAELAVTCGVTVWVADMFDPVCERIWDNLTPEQRDTLTTAANSGRWVLDAGTGLYKHVVSVSNDLWQGIKSVVDSLWNVGDNEITEGGETSVDLSITGITYYYNSMTGLNNLPLILNCDFGDGHAWVYTFYLNSSGVICRNGVMDGVHQDTLTYPSRTNLYFELSSSSAFVYVNYSTDPMEVSQRTQTFCSNRSVVVSATSGGVVVVGTVYGDAGVLDNPDWDWENKDTGKKDLPFIPPMKDLPGLPSLPGTGVSDVIDYDSVKKGLVGKTAQDLALENVGGLTIAQDGTIVNEGVTDTVVTPEPGVEGQTSLKYLFFSKFPFCLPWDLKNAFTLLVAPAEAPAWEIDLVPAGVKNRMGIASDTKWVIDMEGLEVVGQLSRWTSTISFCLSLIVLTRRIIRS